jgi:hypothetical protein
MGNICICGLSFLKIFCTPVARSNVCNGLISGGMCHYQDLIAAAFRFATVNIFVVQTLLFQLCKCRAQFEHILYRSMLQQYICDANN